MAKIDRANILKNKLSKTSFYKLDCYFDKYDTNKITSLIYVYVIAGVSAIDLKLDKDIVIRAKETISKAILPFLAVEAIVIFLITYFPSISMTIPLLTGFAK